MIIETIIENRDLIIFFCFTITAIYITILRILLIKRINTKSKKWSKDM